MGTFIPGMVYYIDTDALNGILNLLTITPKSNATKVRPMLCIPKEDDATRLLEITGEGSEERMRLRNEWKRKGCDRWRKKDQYINDWRSVYGGHEGILTQAVAAEDDYTPYNRPRITREGMEEVMKAYNSKR